MSVADYIKTSLNVKHIKGKLKTKKCNFFIAKRHKFHKIMFKGTKDSQSHTVIDSVIFSNAFILNLEFHWNPGSTKHAVILSIKPQNIKLSLLIATLIKICIAYLRI